MLSSSPMSCRPLELFTEQVPFHGDTGDLLARAADLPRVALLDSGGPRWGRNCCPSAEAIVRRAGTSRDVAWNATLA